MTSPDAVLQIVIAAMATHVMNKVLHLNNRDSVDLEVRVDMGFSFNARE